MKIYCLNLDRATERRALIEEEWINKLNFDIEFFSAFDRRKLEKGEFVFPYDEQKTIERIGRSMSLGEIACATSHCLLLKKALNEGYDEIIVMEDDCLPTQHTNLMSINEVIHNCKTTFPRVKILIMHKTNDHIKIKETKNGINLLTLPPFGFCLVWLNRWAMEILANDLSTMCYPADWLWTKRFVHMKTVASTQIAFGKHSSNNTYIGNEFRLTARNFIS